MKENQVILAVRKPSMTRGNERSSPLFSNASRVLGMISNHVR